MTDPDLVLTRSAERLAVAALTLAGFGIALNVQVLAALGPFLLADGVFTSEEIGTAIAIGWWASAASALVLLPFVDRVGRRGPIVWGLALFCAACAAHLVATDVTSFYVVRAIAGLAGGAAFTVASAAVADIVPYVRRGHAMGVFNLSIFLAVPVGLPLATLLAKAGMWRGVFLLEAVIGAFAVFVLWPQIPASLGRGGGGVRWAVLARPGVLAGLLSVALYSGAFAAVTQFLATWLDTEGIVPRAQHAYLWFGFGIVTAVGAFTLTRLSDRFGKRAFVVATSAVVGLGFLVLPWVVSGWLMILVGVPVAACTAARSGAMVALISGLAPSEERGSLMVLRVAALNLGMGALVWVAGQVIGDGAVGFPSLLWIASAAVALSLSVVILGVKEEPV